MKLLIVCALISLALCDKLPSNSAPYAPSGWKPQGAQLTLPLNQEYGAPSRQQQQRPQKVNFSNENIQFAGQITEATTTLPSNEYLPPGASTDQYPTQETDGLRVQRLPSDSSSNSFNSQLNTGEIVPLQLLDAQKNYRINSLRVQQQQQQRQVQPQQQQYQFGQFNQFNGGIQAPSRGSFGQIKQQSQFVPSLSPAQQQQQSQAQQQQFQPPQQQYGPPQPQFQPQQQYGPPQPQQYYPQPAPGQNVNFEPEQNEDAEEVQQQGPVIAVANAGVNGQYYILAEDNTLQRVVYMTSQTEDDKRSNGFTAQLRYAPVEPIRDPIYAYDSQGQLVKIYNKK